MSSSVPLAPPPRSPWSAAGRPPLTRVRECLVSGTAEGLARHLGAGPALVRGIFIVSAPMAGFGVLLYIWCWMLTPWELGEARPSRRMPVAWLLLAASGVLALIVLAQLGAEYRFGVWRGDHGATSSNASIIADMLTLLVLVAPVVAAALWADHVDRDDPRRGPRHTAVARVTAVVFVIILLLVLLRASDPFLLLVPFAGLLAMFSSSLAQRWRELASERIRRIREEQRSEMAAHLHDSVLQTLALIQNRAGASSEAARLARAQERELRAWLYDGDAPADSDLATDLRDHAGALELDYPARVDVVSAGLSTERASGELAAAAREAMINAARHAGGEVSVYIEGAATGVDVFVRDRGEGFDLDEVPGDRLGVRQSIIGRMRRAGGSATVRSDANGTEVHLRIVGNPAGEPGEQSHG